MLRILAPVYYLGALALAVVVVNSTLGEARALDELARFESATEKTDTLVKDWMENLSLGAYKGGSEKAEEVRSLAEAAGRHARRGRIGAWVLAGGSAAFLALAAGAVRGTGERRRLVGHMTGVSAVLLVVGLCAPLLTISAHKEVAVIGRVVLQYDTKGILDTIAKLALTGNNLLAILLALFSVLLPVSKLVMTMLAVTRWGRVRRAATGAVHAIGRWSMTDVFVVAVMLAFLAADGDQLTDASTGYGLFFFAAYALLSLSAGHLLLKRGPQAPALAAPGGAPPERSPRHEPPES